LCGFIHLLHSIETFGDGDAGRYADDADFFWAEFQGEDAGDDVDCRFGSAVDGTGGGGSDGDSGADVNDYAAFGAEVGDGGLGGEEERLDVEVEVLVDVLGRDGFQGKELVHAGVVDEDVDTTEGLGCCGDEFGDVSGIGEVGLHGDCFAAGGLDAFDEGFGGLGAAGVVDDDGGSVCGETLGDGCTDSLGGAGD